MNRYCLLIASMMMLSGLAVAQQEEKPNKGLSKPKIDQGYQNSYPTEVPDLVGPKATKKATMPSRLKINDEDSSVVKAAKRAIEAQLEALKYMEDQIKGGNFSGGSAYTKTAEVLDGIYDMVKLTSDKPEVLLPWAEYRLQIRAELEEYIVPRDRAGVEVPTTLPRLSAARNKAEIEVLKLREKIKK
jgi:hypothetical protein